MLSRLIKGSTLRFLFSFILVLGAVMFIFTPDYLFMKWISNYTVQVMLSYLGLGFVFLLWKQPRLMFVSFACCASLCVFLNRDVSNPFTRKKPKIKGGEAISAAHFNISRTENTPDEIITLIKNSEADFVSVQEINMEWAEQLQENMMDKYPYLVALPDTSFHGLAIFSKYPILEVDTFHFQNKPNIVGKIKTNEGFLHFISIHTFPAKDQESYDLLVAHLQLISERIKKTDAPLITLGEYNAVSWSEEIHNFKTEARLNDSRKGSFPGFPNGSIDLLEVPVDHIFFTDHLECLEFKTLDTEKSHHLGIYGVYQFKPELKTLNVNRKT